jgi:methyl-accepting chemotaxis protein
LIAAAVLGMAVLVAIFVFSERRMLMEERQDAVRQTVETATSLVAHFHGLATQGKMPEAEAKAAALEAVKGLRYSETEYFWINDMQRVVVMHPIKPEWVGRDMSDLQDANGVKLYAEFVKVVQASGAGFVGYLWPKPGNAAPVPKVCYVKGFAPWGWVIGSGVYVDTVDAAILRRIASSAPGAAVLALLLLGTSLVIARSIVVQLGGEPADANAITHRMAKGDLSVDIALRAGDTFSVMHGIKTMRDNVAHIVAQVREGSHGVATSSAEIAQGNHDLSARTEQQASAVEQTAAAMEVLRAQVNLTADKAGQANPSASSASSEQAANVSQVGEAVTHMDQATQQNAALVEEMAAAASSLKAQAGELVQTVSIFQLGEEDRLV